MCVATTKLAVTGYEELDLVYGIFVAVELCKVS